MVVRSGLQLKFLLAIVGTVVVGHSRAAMEGEQQKELGEKVHAEQILQASNALLKAAKKGDDQGVRQALAQGADIEIGEGVHKYRPLVWAAMNGHTSVARTLLDHKAQVNITHAQGSNDTPLTTACRGGYTDIVTMLLEADADVNMATLFGETALMAAALKGHSNIVTQLLEKKAAVNVVATDQNTPLTAAAYGGNSEVVRMLLDKEADIDAACHGNTVLMIAAQGGHTDTVRLLLDKNADVGINRKNKEGATSLIGAVLGNHAPAARMLVLAGADLDIMNKEGLAAFDYAQPEMEAVLEAAMEERHAVLNITLLKAAKKGDDQGVRQALAQGADIEIGEGVHKFRPLVWAAMNGHTSVARTLLDHKAQVNIVYAQGSNDTPLTTACRGGYSDIVTMLLEADADVNMATSFGQTALMAAALKGHSNIVTQLLEKKAAVNVVATDQNTPLTVAAYGGNPEVVRMLLDKGANIDAARYGNTALMIALQGGHTKIVDMLVDGNADVNKKNNAGVTALMSAVAGGHTQMAQKMVLAGGDIMSADNLGRTPLDVAQPEMRMALEAAIQERQKLLKKKRREEQAVFEKQVQEARVFRERVCASQALFEAAHRGDVVAVQEALALGADINITQGGHGWSSLSFAAMKGHAQVARILLDHKASVDTRLSNGDTPLMVAINHGQMDVADILISYSANVDAVNNCDQTPLSRAIISGYPKMAQMLLNNEADINKVESKNGLTPLMQAVEKKQKDIARMLVLAGADTTLVNKKGSTALEIAHDEGYCELRDTIIQAEQDKQLFDAIKADDSDGVSEALEKGADVNAVGNYGQRPLTAAIDVHGKVVFKSSIESARLLLAKNADINVVDYNGHTALALASIYGQVEAAQFLLDAHANVEVASPCGRAPLSLAVVFNKPDIAQMLIAAGADATRVDKWGKTALDMAKPDMKVALEVAIQERQELLDKKQREEQAALEKQREETQALEAQEAIDCANKALLAAAHNGDNKAVMEALAARADINTAQGSTEWTALHFTAMRGHAQVAQILLDNKAQIDMPWSNGNTPLMDAAHYGHRNVAQVLVDNKANVNATSKSGSTPLIWAATYGQPEIVQLLLDNKADINKAGNDGFTPLSVAILSHDREGGKKVAELLLERNADSNTVTKAHGYTPLMWAASKGYTELAQRLLDNKADSNAQSSKSGMTPLMNAVYAQQAEPVRMLIRAGAQVDLADKQGKTALNMANSEMLHVIEFAVQEKEEREKRERATVTLFEAITQGDSLAVGDALAAGAQVNAQVDNDKYTYKGWDRRQYQGWTPLMIATQKNSTDIVALLLEHNAELNVQAPGGSGWTPLMSTAHSGHIEIARLLLDKKADVNMIDAHNYTPLMRAALGGHAEMVKLLLEKKALGLDGKTQHGSTPLMVVAASARGKQNYIDTLKLLIRAGADVDAVDTNGCTVRNYAKWEIRNLIQATVQEKEQKIQANIRLFNAVKERDIQGVGEALGAGAQVNMISDGGDYAGYTPLRLAAAQGDADMARLLLDNLADVDMRTSLQGRTALVDAAVNGYADMINLLLDKKADIDVRCTGEYDWSPLLFAAMRNNKEALQVLLERNADIAGIYGVAKETALHSAVCNGAVDAVCMLIVAGADMGKEDSEGQTPWDRALSDMREVMTAAQQEKMVRDAQKRAQEAVHVHNLLLEAAKTGNMCMAQEALAAGAKIVDREAEKNSGYDLLSWAVMRGDADMVRLFLQKGAHVNAANVYGKTPLKMAVEHGHEEIVNLLLDNKASVDSEGNGGCTPLWLAARFGHLSIARMLLDNKAAIDTINSAVCDYTPLLQAAEQGHEMVATLLIEAGADCTYTTPAGENYRTVARTDIQQRLWEAYTEREKGREQKRQEEARLFEEQAWRDLQELATAKVVTSVVPVALVKPVQNKAKLNERLLRAIHDSNAHDVLSVLRAGADINAIHIADYTPLMWAVRYKKRSMIKLLIDKNAHLDMVDKNGNTALMHAASLGDHETVLLLLDNKALVNSVNNYGDDALMVAITNGHSDIVRTVLDYGAAVNGTKNDNDTPLIRALQKNRQEIAQMLCERGADVNKAGKKGVSPLWWAVYGGQEEMVRVLIEAGAHSDMVSLDSLTPGLKELIEGLRKKHDACEEIESMGSDYSNGELFDGELSDSMASILCEDTWSVISE